MSDVRKLTLTFFIVLSNKSYGVDQKILFGSSMYQDKQLKISSLNSNYNVSQGWFGSDQYLSSFVLGVNYSNIENRLQKKSDVIGDLDSAKQTSYLIDFTQNYGLFAAFGVFYNLSVIQSDNLTEEDSEDKNHSMGGRWIQWWFSESLKSTLEYRNNKIDQTTRDFTATDGVRVILPQEVEGDNINLGLYHLATKSTIMNYSLSYTDRSDRPNAWGLSAEWRQYIDKLNASMHLGLSHYRNVGRIQPITLDGEVLASTLDLAWHQKFAKQYVLISSYRFHWEEHDPREFDAPKEQNGSDYLNFKLRYRFKSEAWTEDSSELVFLVGKYLSNQPSEGYIGGLGGALIF